VRSVERMDKSSSDSDNDNDDTLLTQAEEASLATQELDRQSSSQASPAESNERRKSSPQGSTLKSATSRTSLRASPADSSLLSGRRKSPRGSTAQNEDASLTLSLDDTQQSHRGAAQTAPSSVESNGRRKSPRGGYVQRGSLDQSTSSDERKPAAVDVPTRQTGADPPIGDGGGDDDASDDDVDSSSSSDGDDDEFTATTTSTTLTLTEKRARNVHRNNSVLASLGIAHGMVQLRQSRKRKSADTAMDESDTVEDRPRGMLLTGLSKQRESASNVAQRLNQRYPHREAQIRKLKSLLSVPVMAASHAHNHNNDNPFVPPPIFVTGPAGCGKTAVVQDVIHEVAANKENDSSYSKEAKAIHAYIDCATLDSANIEELVMNAYTQLAVQVRSSGNRSGPGKRLPPLCGTEFGIKPRHKKDPGTCYGQRDHLV
jgi:hypothetical protein